MKNWKVAIILIIITVIISSLYKIGHSPEYTIKQINTAIEENDWDTFIKYVDVDALVTAHMNKASDDSSNRFVKGFTLLASEYIKTTAVARLKQAIETPGGYPMILHDLVTAENVTITSEGEGKVRYVAILSKFGRYDVPASLYITMRSEGFRYIVIDIDNSEIEHRESVVSDIYKEYYLFPIREKINAAIKVSFVKRHEGCADYIGDTCIEHLILLEHKVENLTNKNISEVRIEMYPSAKFAEQDTEYEIQKLSFAENIPAKRTITFGRESGWKYNKYDNEDKIWMNVSESGIMIRPTRVTFSDGEILELDEYGYITQELPKLNVVAEWAKNNSIEYADKLNAWLNE